MPWSSTILVDLNRHHLELFDLTSPDFSFLMRRSSTRQEQEDLELALRLQREEEERAANVRAHSGAGYQQAVESKQRCFRGVLFMAKRMVLYSRFQQGGTILV